MKRARLAILLVLLLPVMSGLSLPARAANLGEVATLHYAEGTGTYPFRLTANGDYAIDGREAGVQPGPLAFGFDGGKGTVDNVVIKGKLDMRWLLQHTMGTR